MTANISCPRTGPAAPGTLPARHGAILRREAEELLGCAEIAAGLAEGLWVEPWHGVLVPETRQHDPLTRAAAALLRGGPYSLLSGPTAAAMHGCGAAAGDVLHVTVPYDRELRSAPDLIVHQAWVRESDVVELDGLRVQALDVAIAELLCTGPQRLALACLEQALAQLDDTSEHFRARVAERLARRRDRRGTRQAAALLELAWSRPPDELVAGGAR
ncbi:hypothetical protein GCM10011581_13320 [Saccharopolyspora subtropica]|uniref:AbiEi antitoxin C-terminal domain-containing protein n=1 Tax=Saccharopolyspora thermophila TaxID=89367 RepID=A0A917JMK9_9PSEU|nr:hypothetical protein [Saccharopolyspora subtropica]GGI77568.1 hypothetical protein GCM10011581_13320 [Saccharopolyspora subtropica]